MAEKPSRPRLRLFVSHDLGEGQTVVTSKEQTHYLATVMRAGPGEEVLLFNGRDGEWLARTRTMAKAGASLDLVRQTRTQASEPDLWLLAAPIKRERIDLVAEKAAELGASALWPVFTRHTAMTRVNGERLAAHLVEAAEQCERLTVPELKEPAALDKALAGWDSSRILLFLDETGEGLPIAEAAAALPENCPLALLVGPEGGFSPEERRWLVGLPYVRPVCLGPRILRAETAAIAGMAILQAIHGDWANKPHMRKVLA